MSSKNFRAHLLYAVHHIKSFGEFKLKLQSGNAQFGSKSAICCPVWPWNLMDDLEKQKGISSILHQALCIIFKPWMNSNWSYSPETLNSGQNQQFLVSCDLEIWRMTLNNNRAPLPCCFKPCASFHSHQWIQTRVTLRKRPIWVTIDIFFVPCDLEIWQMTLKNNRTPLLCYFKLCASFCSHWWIKTGATVRKPPIGVKSQNRWPWKQ